MDAEDDSYLFAAFDAWDSALVKTELPIKRERPVTTNSFLDDDVVFMGFLSAAADAPSSSVSPPSPVTKKSKPAKKHAAIASSTAPNPPPAAHGPRATTKILDNAKREPRDDTEVPVVPPSLPGREEPVADAMDIDNMDADGDAMAAPPTPVPALVETVPVLTPAEVRANEQARVDEEHAQLDASGDAMYRLLVDMDNFIAGEAEEQLLWDALHALARQQRALYDVIRRLEDRIIGDPDLLPFSKPLERVRDLASEFPEKIAALRTKNLKRTENMGQLARRCGAISMGLGAVPGVMDGGGTETSVTSDQYMLRFENGALLPYDTTERVTLNEFDII